MSSSVEVRPAYSFPNATTPPEQQMAWSSEPAAPIGPGSGMPVAPSLVSLHRTSLDAETRITSTDATT
jgi:hypothetical protein